MQSHLYRAMDSKFLCTCFEGTKYVCAYLGLARVKIPRDSGSVTMWLRNATPYQTRT